MTPIASCPLCQIWDLQKIRKNIIAVIPQKRIAIEQYRRNAGDHHDIVGERADKSLLDREPHIQGQGGNKDFNDHSRSTDKRTLPFAPKFGCCGRVDIRHRREHEEHDPDLVDRSSESFYCISVPKLVQGLEYDKTQSHHQNVIGSKNAIRGVLAELLPVLGAQHNCRQHDDHPQHDAAPADEPIYQR